MATFLLWNFYKKNIEPYQSLNGFYKKGIGALGELQKKEKLKIEK